ncbi:hypothetical protein [Aquabacterium sp.]|uniref:hypothetical protein n=1 Tax=Aquabacterium sp. TaxID=1872578 RepID=UPI002CDF8CAF|nr:hypothetical protein [Aquabacterium sp.]HSW05268.1 hypothetical protein [Aquabacterium sp.]
MVRELSAAARRKHGRVGTRRWLATMAVAMATCVAQAQTVLPEVQVSKAYIPDLEFDWGRNGVFCQSCNFGTSNARFAFSDANMKLWIGYIDFQTGAFYPPDGRAVLLDSSAAAPTDFGNGPEWVGSSGNSQLVYTKYLSGQAPSETSAGVALAQMINGSWSTGFMSNAVGRASPAGSQDLTDADPRINYVASDKSGLFWRSLSQPDVENILPISELTSGNSRRWVPGTRKIIFQGHPPNSPALLIDQVYLYDTNSGELEQLTFDADGKLGAFMWRAPEFNNDYVFITMARLRKQLQVYRKVPGADGQLRWTVIKAVNTPSALPYIWSPEAFTHNGRSFVFMQLSASSKFWDRSVPNQLAITGIDPLRQDFRMLTNDRSKPRLRLDPEFFITAKGPYIYYNRVVPETSAHPAVNDGVWRVDTKLGAPKQH